jgi:hypothetical protein
MVSNWTPCQLFAVSRAGLGTSGRQETIASN